jgi:hypothetical protein
VFPGLRYNSRYKSAVQRRLKVDDMPLTIHPVAEKHSRNGFFKGYAISGWDYKEGWFISLSSIGNGARNIWVSGSFESPSFAAISNTPSDVEGVVEIDPEPIELSGEEKYALLSMVWEWEIWERTVAEGTCMIESVERMLEVPRDEALDWFRRTRRDPSGVEHVVETLQENGHEMESLGPEGFGQFRSQKRLVLMLRKDNPRKGHAVVVYENDTGIFDADNRFKQVGDLLFADGLGYRIGAVLIKKRDGFS